ncbi:Concanavalin A-like lectin/glucanase domain protein [Raphanus sativus]|nr:Concanavalin A-like lectin/glucanase domain protein [Raphanus sativus]
MCYTSGIVCNMILWRGYETMTCRTLIGWSRYFGAKSKFVCEQFDYLELERLEAVVSELSPVDVGPASQLDIEAEFKIKKDDLEVIFGDDSVEDDKEFSCGSSGGATVRGALGPFGFSVLADESLSEQTPVYFYVTKGKDSKLKTFFCTDTSRSTMANDVVKPVYGSFVPVLKREKLTMRILSDAEQENDLDESYKEVRETLVKLGTENLALAKEKARLEVEVQVLKDDLNREAELAKESVNLIKEKLVLSKQADELREELLAERKKAADLQAELDQQYRKIKMLTGTKQLDKILSSGRTENSLMGLGYTGRQSSSTVWSLQEILLQVSGTSQTSMETTQVLENREDFSRLDEENRLVS